LEFNNIDFQMFSALTEIGTLTQVGIYRKNGSKVVMRKLITLFNQGLFS